MIAQSSYGVHFPLLAVGNSHRQKEEKEGRRRNGPTKKRKNRDPDGFFLFVKIMTKTLIVTKHNIEKNLSLVKLSFV